MMEEARMRVLVKEMEVRRSTDLATENEVLLQLQQKDLLGVFAVASEAGACTCTWTAQVTQAAV